MSAVEQIHIPDKLFYRIQEVATITQIKPYVLRYWETEFSMLAPPKDENDQRRYRRCDIELIIEIKRLLYSEKFTIAGARRRLKGVKETPSAEIRSMEGGPVVVDLQRYRRLSDLLQEMRKDVADLYKLFPSS